MCGHETSHEAVLKERHPIPKVNEVLQELIKPEHSL